MVDCSNISARAITADLGGSWHGHYGSAPCPLCQPERRRDQRALSIGEANGNLLLFCFKKGCDFRAITGAVGVARGSGRIDEKTRGEAEARRARFATDQRNKARDFWHCAGPIAGTMAETYLRSRSITCSLAESLRFAPNIYHKPSTSWCCAMVADVQPTGGVHRTFFDKSGTRLPKNAKMMLGPCAGGAVRLSQADGPLVVCEGIETGLSLLSGLLDGPARVWAALSTSGMTALELPPEPGRLIVATDGDAPGREAGEKLAKRAVSLGWEVGLLPAPDGLDWNDILVGAGVVK